MRSVPIQLACRPLAQTLLTGLVSVLAALAMCFDPDASKAQNPLIPAFAGIVRVATPRPG